MNIDFEMDFTKKPFIFKKKKLLYKIMVILSHKGKRLKIVFGWIAYTLAIYAISLGRNVYDIELCFTIKKPRKTPWKRQDLEVN